MVRGFTCWAVGWSGSLGSASSRWGLDDGVFRFGFALRQGSPPDAGRAAGVMGHRTERPASGWQPCTGGVCVGTAVHSAPCPPRSDPALGRPIICTPADIGWSRIFGFMQPAVQHHLVDEESDGQRLDNLLIRLLKGVPKSAIHRVIRSGEVRVNKGRARSDHRVHTGDLIRLPPLRMGTAPDPEVRVPAPPRTFPVVHEDEVMLVIDKPAGVAVHGGSGVSWGVVEQLRSARADVKSLELVHRLDRETSGLLLLAKRKSALRVLQQQFRDRTVRKTYLALVRGDWPQRLKVLDGPLRKWTLDNGERRVRVTDAQDPEGMRAVSLVRVLGRLPLPAGLAGPQSGSMSLLAVTIKTGRTHQIRVHLSHAGHPIAGDDKYGDFAWNRLWQKSGLTRMYLHAWQLSMLHPVDGRPMEWTAPLPEELRAIADVSNLNDHE